jgi:hypothetical protein
LKKNMLISVLVVAAVTLAVGGWIVGGARTILKPWPRLRPRPA